MKTLFFICFLSVLAWPLGSSAQETGRKQDADTTIFSIVEEMPVFRYKRCVGDFFCVQDYISDSLRYPDSLCAGKVYLNFVVEKDGKVTNVEIRKGMDNCPGYNEEALRVISSLPAWIPGKRRGRPARVMMMTEVEFRKRK